MGLGLLCRRAFPAAAAPTRWADTYLVGWTDAALETSGRATQGYYYGLP